MGHLIGGPVTSSPNLGKVGKRRKDMAAHSLPSQLTHQPTTVDLTHHPNRDSHGKVHPTPSLASATQVTLCTHRSGPQSYDSRHMQQTDLHATFTVENGSPVLRRTAPLTSRLHPVVKYCPLLRVPSSRSLGRSPRPPSSSSRPSAL